MSAGAMPPNPGAVPPPQRRLGPCPQCGLTVLAEAWEERGARLVPRGPLLSPCLGQPHDCALALVQYAARWQYAVVLGQGDQQGGLRS